MIFSSLFAILMGAGMIINWAAFYKSKQIPELDTTPIAFAFHFAAEMLTAVGLIAGGVGLLLSRSWASPVFFISIGMLLYTAIASPGYFAQQGKWSWVGIFAAITTVTLLSLIPVMSLMP